MGPCLALAVLLGGLPGIAGLVAGIIGLGAGYSCRDDAESWLIALGVAGLVHLLAGVHLFRRFAAPYGQDPRDASFLARFHYVMCYDSWLALYMLLFVGAIVMEAFAWSASVRNVDTPDCGAHGVHVTFQTLVFLHMLYLLLSVVLVFLLFVRGWVITYCCTDGTIRSCANVFCPCCVPSRSTVQAHTAGARAMQADKQAGTTRQVRKEQHGVFAAATQGLGWLRTIGAPKSEQAAPAASHGAHPQAQASPYGAGPMPTLPGQDKHARAVDTLPVAMPAQSGQRVQVPAYLVPRAIPAARGSAHAPHGVASGSQRPPAQAPMDADAIFAEIEEGGKPSKR